MTHNKPSSNERGTQPKRQGVRDKRIRVEPTRRKRVDPDMIALCYWLIAQRIVEEAGDASDNANHPHGPAARDDHHTTDTPEKDARS